VYVPGFITGLCWSLCALAHGQKKLAALQEGLPAASAYALEHGSSLFKHGAGISAGSLETIVLASLKAMLALPAPAKRVTGAETPETLHADARAERRARLPRPDAPGAEARGRLPRRGAPSAETRRAETAERRGSRARCRLLPRLRLLPRRDELRKATFGQSPALPRDEAEQPT
jgi:hypothetical protein